MPCRDSCGAYPATPYPAPYPYEAMLCAIVSSIPAKHLSTFLDRVDWKESGVKRNEFTKWWQEHQKADETRRQKEAEAAERNRVRREALNKLTPEERKALGVHDPNH